MKSIGIRTCHVLAIIYDFNLILNVDEFDLASGAIPDGEFVLDLAQRQGERLLEIGDSGWQKPDQHVWYKEALRRVLHENERVKRLLEEYPMPDQNSYWGNPNRTNEEGLDLICYRNLYHWVKNVETIQPAIAFFPKDAENFQVRIATLVKAQEEKLARQNAGKNYSGGLSYTI